MNVKYRRTVAVTIAFSVCTFTAQASENNNARYNRGAQQPTSDYWQTPNWPGFSAPPARSSAAENKRLPARNNNDSRRPVAPNDRRPYRVNNYPARNNDRPVMGRSNMNQFSRENRTAPPPRQNAYRGKPYPPQRGPYPGPNMNRYHSDNAAPVYDDWRNRSYPHKNARNSQFRDNRDANYRGPNRWMNPNRGSMGRGWNDMTNGPARMGRMPGGWRAPEVNMPNPVDMGDQMQGNAKDLPEQMRNMDVGN